MCFGSFFRLVGIGNEISFKKWHIGVQKRHQEWRRHLSWVLGVLLTAWVHVLQCILSCARRTQPSLHLSCIISPCCAAPRATVSQLLHQKKRRLVCLLGQCRSLCCLALCPAALFSGEWGRQNFSRLHMPHWETHLLCQGCFLTCETVSSLSGNEPKCSWSVLALYWQFGGKWSAHICIKNANMSRAGIRGKQKSTDIPRLKLVMQKQSASWDESLKRLTIVCLSVLLCCDCSLLLRSHTWEFWYVCQLELDPSRPLWLSIRWKSLIWSA